MSDEHPDEQGYDGPAVVVAEQRTVEVAVLLRGAFQPIDGRYHWYGRVEQSPEIDDVAGSGSEVVLRTSYGEAVGRLSDRDPWGRLRITGTGVPPFAVD